MIYIDRTNKTKLLKLIMLLCSIKIDGLFGLIVFTSDIDLKYF